jgi:hypothetical protein
MNQFFFARWIQATGNHDIAAFSQDIESRLLNSVSHQYNRHGFAD